MPFPLFCDFGSFYFVIFSSQSHSFIHPPDLFGSHVETHSVLNFEWIVNVCSRQRQRAADRQTDRRIGSSNAVIQNFVETKKVLHCHCCCCGCCLCGAVLKMIAFEAIGNCAYPFFSLKVSASSFAGIVYHTLIIWPIVSRILLFVCACEYLFFFFSMGEHWLIHRFSFVRNNKHASEKIWTKQLQRRLSDSNAQSPWQAWISHKK